MKIGFKEWAVVCEALGSGRQSLILRKGGIAEGREGFRFEHEEFLLFPTWFHEQVAKTILPEETPLPPVPEEELELAWTAVVEWTRLVTDADRLAKLRDFHILSESVIRERFEYDDVRGVHVAFVRVFRLDPPIRLRNEKRYGGCRSWVDLPQFDDCACVSVVTDEEHARRRAAIEALLGV